VRAALSVIFGNGTIEYNRYAREAERCWNLPAIKYGAEILLLLREAASFLTEELAIATANA
jgi:hypothetical protein